jgi:hypothetical protein
VWTGVTRDTRPNPEIISQAAFRTAQLVREFLVASPELTNCSPASVPLAKMRKCLPEEAAPEPALHNFLLPHSGLYGSVMPQYAASCLGDVDPMEPM